MENFAEYQRLAGVTRKEDPQPLELAHYALGMVGEAGELSSPAALPVDDYIKEIGDCFWYAAGVCSVMGYTLEDFADMDTITRGFQLSNVLNVLMTSAANICEQAKKFQFYGKAPSDVVLRSNLHDYVSCLFFLCRMIGENPLSVCDKNIRKLEARFQGKFDAFRAVNRDVEAEAEASK